MRDIVYYYTHVEQPFPLLAALLSADPGLWLPAPAQPEGDTWRVALHAGGALPRAPGHQLAEVRVGAAMESETGLIRRVVWQPTGAGNAVPALEADLALAPLEGYGCQLSMMGSYRPTLASDGGAGVRLRKQRIAQGCVRGFVMDVGQRVGAARLPA